jgi:putative Ca2+/H+ antiporter (TMEM165/GDT1 family)
MATVARAIIFPATMWDTLLSSTTLVAFSETGDKTQLLAFTLAARYRKPWVVLGGILVATLLNHGLAAWAGTLVSGWLSPTVLPWLLAACFLGFGLWILVPDKDEDSGKEPRFGPFLTTAILFFLAEMGDKTQFATIALGAKYQSVLWVTAGTTLGMLIADGLAIFLGEKLADKVQAKWIRIVTAVLFIGFGLLSLVQALRG